MRRSVNPTRKISITLPQSVFDHLNQLLSYDQSRSAYISSAIVEKMNRMDGIDMRDISTTDLIESLQYRFHKDSPEDVLIQSLLQILAK